MKVLVIGANGFVGSNVCEALRTEHDVIPADRAGISPDSVAIDLMDSDSIAKVLRDVQPEAVVNCAGVTDNNEKAKLNGIFTKNLLEQVVATGLKPKSIVFIGSAGEYGIVEPDEIPVKETTPLRATSPYGMSKIEESETALGYREKYGLPVVIARLFNPVGIGIGGRLLVPFIFSQIEEVKQGKRTAIEVNRLDAMRDFVHVRDAAKAIALLATRPGLKYDVYNIGSGKSISTGDLIKLMLEKSQLAEQPEVVEQSDVQEPQVASQADISRLQQEGWTPALSIREAIEEIIDAKRG